MTEDWYGYGVLVGMVRVLFTDRVRITSSCYCTKAGTSMAERGCLRIASLTRVLTRTIAGSLAHSGDLAVLLVRDVCSVKPYAATVIPSNLSEGCLVLSAQHQRHRLNSGRDSAYRTAA